MVENSKQRALELVLELKAEFDIDCSIRPRGSWKFVVFNGSHLISCRSWVHVAASLRDIQMRFRLDAKADNHRLTVSQLECA